MRDLFRTLLGPVEQFGVLATLSRWRPRVQIPSGPLAAPAAAWLGSSVGTSDRLKSDRSPVRSRPQPPSRESPDGYPSGLSLLCVPAETRTDPPEPRQRLERKEFFAKTSLRRTLRGLPYVAWLTQRWGRTAPMGKRKRSSWMPRGCAPWRIRYAYRWSHCCGNTVLRRPPVSRNDWT
ncbi:protein of unknown function [Streptomyces sp. KY75]|nr:protein of unknown function [Streptomyces sp. KY70]CAD5976199.1 protein of unknown function [Streptomyces sp. KY75]